MTPSIWCGCCWPGKLHAVRVPGDEEEALRDLVRAREAVRMDLMRCRHRLSKLLLRHGIRFDDGAAWTARHRQWLATVTLDVAGGADDAARRPRRDRRARASPRQLEREIVAMLPSSPWALQVGRLRCLRGVDTLTAVGLCAEIGDFERFARAEQLMSYVGLVPSESHDRAAAPARLDHEDRLRARTAAARRGGMALPRPPEHRQRAHRPPGRTSPPEAIAIAWSAQRRLHRTWTRLEARAKRRTIIAVAAARELAGFAWAITQNRVTTSPNIAYPVGWVGGGPATRGEPAS